VVRWRHLVWLFPLLMARDTVGERALADYQYFRALSIDLVGRPPTRPEIADFERPDFDLPTWIGSHLVGDGYSERLRRIYMDLLRLEIGSSFQFVPSSITLRRQQILGPDGQPLVVYFRRGQRRVDVAIDGDFCLTRDETGLSFPPNVAPTGTAKPVDKAVLDARTVIVKPWWLYADYRVGNPIDRASADWVRRFPGFRPVDPLLFETDG
jgi:hypothetical protein